MLSDITFLIIIIDVLKWLKSPDKLNDEEDEHKTDTAQHRSNDCSFRVVYRADNDFELK